MSKSFIYKKGNDGNTIYTARENDITLNETEFSLKDNIDVKDITAVDISGLGLYNLSGDGILINNSGFVGINMSGASPMHHLDVSGNVRITGNLTVSGVNISGNTIYASTQFVGDLSGENISGNTIYASTQFVGDLSGDNISGGTITASDISSNHIYGTNISGVNISGNHIYGTNISGVNISGDHIYGTNISGVNISGEHIYGTNISGVNISGEHIYGTNISGVNISGDNITASDISSNHIYGTNISGDNISGGTITATQFVGGTLTNCTFPSGIIIQVEHKFMTNYLTSYYNWQSNQALNSRMGIGDLQITFTPKSSNSRLLLSTKIRYSQRHVVSWGFSQHFNTTTSSHKTIVEGSNSINSDYGWVPVADSINSGSLNNCLVVSYTGGLSNAYMGSLSMDHMIDAVDTTERTYIPTFRAGWTILGDETIVINNREGGANGGMKSTSTMTIYEIAQ